MRKILFIFISGAVILGFSGCGASLGLYPTVTETQVQLNRKNFKVIKSGIVGTAECWYVLNVFPLDDTELYKRAMNEIRKQADALGKPYAIVNITQDFSASTYFVVGRAAVTLTADVVEFTE